MILLSEPIALLSLPGTNLFQVTNKAIFKSKIVGDVLVQLEDRELTTDLTTVPWFARWIYSKSGKYKDAAIIHDAMLQSGKYTRRQCDLVFKEAMQDAGIHPVNVAVLYGSTRLYAKVKGKK